MNYQEYRRKKVKQQSKYGNKKTVVDGITFDSKAESIYYQQLNGSFEIVEIKGSITKEFALKRKLFEMKFLDSITLLKYEPKMGFVEVE